MIYEFIRAEKALFPVSVLCQVLLVSRSGSILGIEGIDPGVS